ncbi:MAG: hypothetical protein ABIF88_01280 [archaeon]
MKQSIKKGFSFGLTSGIITTLGLIVGLNSTTHSKSIVIGGILVIAIADALSDAMGIHMAEESSKKPNKQIWEATISTFFFKFIFALTFVIPILLFQLSTAIIVSIVWGLLLIATFSYTIAKDQKTNPSSVIFEHVLITVIVIIATNYIGSLISKIGLG